MEGRIKETTEYEFKVVIAKERKRRA